MDLVKKLETENFSPKLPQSGILPGDEQAPVVGSSDFFSFRVSPLLPPNLAPAPPGGPSSLQDTDPEQGAEQAYFRADPKNREHFVPIPATTGKAVPGTLLSGHLPSRSLQKFRKIPQSLICGLYIPSPGGTSGLSWQCPPACRTPVPDPPGESSSLQDTDPEQRIKSAPFWADPQKAGTFRPNSRHHGKTATGTLLSGHLRKFRKIPQDFICGLYIPPPGEHPDSPDKHLPVGPRPPNPPGEPSSLQDTDPEEGAERACFRADPQKPGTFRPDSRHRGKTAPDILISGHRHSGPPENSEKFPRTSSVAYTCSARGNIRLSCSALLPAGPRSRILRENPPPSRARIRNRERSGQVSGQIQRKRQLTAPIPTTMGKAAPDILLSGPCHFGPLRKFRKIPQSLICGLYMLCPGGTSGPFS